MRFPLFAPLVAAGLLMAGAGAPIATATAADTRTVQAAIDDALPAMTRKVFAMDVPGAEVPPEVTAWLQDGLPRKIRVEHLTSHGPIVEEFYYGPGEDLPKLLFATRAITTETADGKTHGTVRHRFTVEDGVLIRWRDGSGQSVPRNSEEFRARAAELFEDSSRVLAALQDAGGASGGPVPEPGPVEETTGVFAGIEFGDYAYLLLTVGGEDLSFMMLRPDDTLERLLDSPDRYVGRTITVVWQTVTETLPEAGGPVEVTMALSVKGL
ncbi:hypothetical protein ACM64Y_18565 [Novispirillum sp. DQ9]|uniref:hypothetical protein n=1 Tax=Novispirillum sp. DQ9 TaxID=3398612 RepID=UPI003C7C7D7E